MQYIKQLVSSTKTKDFAVLAKTFDPNQNLRKGARALKSLHIKLIFGSLVLELIAPLVKHLANNLFPIKKKAHNKKLIELDLFITEKINQLGLGKGIIESTKNVDKNQLNSFFSDDDKSNTEKDAEQWLIIPNEQDDKLLTPEELSKKKRKEKLHEAKLKGKLQELLQITQKFYDMTKEKTVNRMIKDYNPELFKNEEVMKNIKFFDKDSQKTIEFFDPKHFEDCKFNTPFACFTHAQRVDQIVHTVWEKKSEEAKKQDKFVTPEPQSFLNKFWKELNNAELMCKTLHEVSDEKFQIILDFVCNIIDDVMNGKIEDLTTIPMLIKNKIKETTQFNEGNDAGSIGEFILEAVYHNASMFTSAFETIQSNIPDELFDLAKERGYDFKNMDLVGMVGKNVQKMIEIRNENKYSEGTKNFVKKSLEFLDKSATNIADSNKNK